MTDPEITIVLPPKVAYIFKVYAAIEDDTVESLILHELDAVADAISDGFMFSQEIKSAYANLSAAEPEAKTD